MERRNLDLAYALAREALDGPHGVNGNEAIKAQSIIDQSMPRDAQRRPPMLKNPWRLDLGYIGAHLVMLLAVPVSAIAAFWLACYQ